MTPLDFIETVRELHPDMVNACTKGNCWKFAKLLMMVFPDAIPYYDGDHVITRIGNQYWDITGRVNKDKHIMFTRPERRLRCAEDWEYGIKITPKK